MKMIYKKKRGLNSNLKIKQLPTHLQPEDLWEKEAMVHADMILNDYVPSNIKKKVEWH